MYVALTYFYYQINIYDVATLSDLVRKISGQIYKYEFLMTDTHGKRL